MAPPLIITTLFLGRGGVILTNGWGRAMRRSAAGAFGLDSEDLNGAMVAEAAETLGIQGIPHTGYKPALKELGKLGSVPAHSRGSMNCLH